MSEKKVVEKKAAADKVAVAEKAAKKTTKKAAADQAEEKKAPVRRTKKVAATTFVEANGSQFEITGLTEKVVAAFEAEGNKASAIKSLEVYVKPEEHKAYYVINGEAEGKSVEL